MELDPDARCASCGSRGLATFYEVRDVPVHSVLLMPTREKALAYPRGDVRLGLCQTCGFVANTAFDPDVHEYSTEYEETQGFSPTFNAFADRLAQRMVTEYDIRGKTVLEIGCGKGEFLTRLVELGGNRGIGIDPAIVPARLPPEQADRTRWIQDFYSEAHADLQADFVCCRHTLEHIAPVRDFLGLLRRTIGERSDTLVLFELPETLRVLAEGAFWDVYYEHCSYFTPGSLARLFRASGFELAELSLDYDDQYLLVVARPAQAPTAPALPLEDDLERTHSLAARFERLAPERIAHWRETVSTAVRAGRRVAIWGAGSKAVAFLTTLGIGDAIEVLVDVNPFKQGRFMPATGQEVVAPEFLADFQPHVVIAMNPIYGAEIRADLDRLGLSPELLTP